MKTRSAYNPTSTTKGYWTLNGNSIDISGNTNTGTDTSITYPQGKFRQGAKLLKTNSSVITYTTTPVISGTGNFTVSGWISFSTIAGSGCLAINVGHQATNQQFSLGVTSGVFNGNWYGGAGGISSGTYAPKLNKWYHVCSVINGASNIWYLYINGQLYGTPVVAPAYNMSSSGSNGNIFGNYTVYDANWGFDGLIDEVIIESRAWSAKEVETYYRKSVLNYKTGILSKLLQSFSILEDINLSESISTLRTRLFSVSETATLTESITTALGKIFTVIESVSLSEVLSTSRSFLFNILDSVSLTEIKTSLEKKWNNLTKNISTWSNSTKNTSTFTNQTKNTSNWDNQNKN